MDVVVNELALISRSICPQESTIAILLSIFVFAFVACPIRPGFLTMTMLLVFFPVAFILRTICVVILAESMGFVIFPFSLIHVTVCMNESTSAVCLIVSPESFIQRPISPDLSALAIPSVAFNVPLTLVPSAVLKGHQRLSLSPDVIPSRLLGFKVEWAQGSLDVLN
jgi:hypothetical protein